MSSYIGSCASGGGEIALKGEPELNATCFCQNCRRSSGNVGQIVSKYDIENIVIEEIGDARLAQYAAMNPKSGCPITSIFAPIVESPFSANPWPETAKSGFCELLFWMLQMLLECHCLKMKQAVQGQHSYLTLKSSLHICTIHKFIVIINSVIHKTAS